MKKIVLLGMVALAMVLAACSAQTGGANLDLVGSEWVLSSLNGQPPLEGTTVTLGFQESNNAGGSSGCNSYGGEYRLDGEKLSFGALAMTEMACMDPAGVMDQESAFLQTLSQAAGAKLVDGKLEIQNAQGETILVFTRK